MPTPTDPLYGQQWHFPLLGDIETIWDEFTGNGVTVAVYDDGVQYTHEDLDGNYDASMHLNIDLDGDGNPDLHDPTPNTGGDGHGTACAGIIGAEANNGVGGTGVAHGVTLTGVDYLNEIQFLADNVVQQALAYAGNFDIMSNSWGRTPLWGSYQNATDPNSAVSNELAGMEAAATTGRGGLGTIIVQASGNDTSNANGDGINSSRHTLSVAATDQAGFATWYTNFGPAILLTAPASAVTTDLEGADGYDPTNYTTSFGGTSAATPTVAGVIALMLEANPNLGWRDVHNILAVTASQTGEELDGSNSGVYEIGDWYTDGYRGGSSWNGGLLSYHLSYGFGMVDAFAAVRMAETWLTMFGDAQTTSNEQHVNVDYDDGTFGPVAIPDYNGTPGQAGVTLNVAQDITIETIMVTVDITHSYGADLEIYLINPDGDIIPLFGGDAGAPGSTLGWGDGNSSLMDNGWTWTFEVRTLLGFSSLGNWQVVVLDTWGGDTGVINDVQIDFYGATADVDDVHIISRDFLEFTAHDASRMVIQDTNGGTDWLNFTGIQGDVVLNMAGGGVFSVNGQNWGSLQAGPAVFENAVMGDGNDTVTGNGLDNEILGMRGDDTIRGRNGDDHLEGGDGTDFLYGENNNDELFGGDDWDFLFGGNDQDRLFGQDGTDRLLGGNGNDDLFGGNQVDYLFGGDNADFLYGGNAGDFLYGENGSDTIFGQDGADTIFGGDGVDTLNGGGSGDTIYGGGSGDTIYGGNGADRLFGDGGMDIIFGQDGSDTIFGGTGNDTLNGGVGSDTIYGGDNADDLFGGDQNDFLFGQNGNDDLFGQNGSDTLNGGADQDRLNGGADNDFLTGGAGSDIFVFANNMAIDVVTDFRINTDGLEFSSSLLTGALIPINDGADLLAAFGSTSGNDVIINLLNGNVVTLTDALLTGTYNDIADDITIV